ncbi:MAG: ABC transporter ATP-binding protein [Schwartzia succinivorans]|jgi:ABC-2 type transport system ATP-binding protein|uniref:ATP-binding cassette domain-containing protein n=1 Tax=Schwartzia succinivorans TaxID=55507 RepID=UPI002352A072|nr:ATP-binding cassette domain-containing protein [Schwartzia succinivorans]MBE6096738.1 ABC transporter ATP-binding protein [Schwartzia succinivorans]
MNAQQEYVVTTENLTKVFPQKNGTPVTALEPLNVQVKKGVLSALIGPDGAGKTTFMRLIAGLMLPTDGHLTVLGKNVAETPQSVQDELSYMPQKFGLYEDLSVEENMNLYADLHGIPKDIRPERFDRLLTMTGLSPFTKRLAGKLSGGMKQKLGLACTLVRSPSLLLLDEPTVGVDPLSRRELWEILKSLVENDPISILVNTSYMDEAEMCADVFVMNRGRILMHGAPVDIRALAKNLCFSVQPPESVPTRVLQSLLLDDSEHIIDAVPDGGRVHFITRGTEQSPVLDDFSLTAEAVPERLEDGFMLLMHKDLEEHPDLASPQMSKHDDKILRAQKRINAEEGLPVDIEVKNLVRKFGDFTAVANTSFSVHQGEIFGLLGPNGAGKTTTFRMLCGLLPATSGYLNVAGVDLSVSRTKAREKLGYVAQKFSLYGNLSVFENLRFFGGAYGLSGETLKNRINEVIDEFSLHGRENDAAESLPGGYKQRLSMAAALMHKPKILFLDEPTSGIDPLARRQFWRQITDLSAHGTTIIITTHFMEEAEYCDRIMIQDQGRLFALGSPEDIREELGLKHAPMNEVFITIVENGRKEEHK